MFRPVSTGIQQFDYIRDENLFYVDKTHFIEQWWKRKHQLTLITRPRRFGKTVMMSAVKCFFSNRCKGREDLFDGLYIGSVPEMMAIQGTYPVIALSFSECKHITDSEHRLTEYQCMVRQLKSVMSKLFFSFNDVFEKNCSKISEDDKNKFQIIRDNDAENYSDDVFGGSLQILCRLLIAEYGKKPIIILDEYDTPLHESYAKGYWKDLVALMRSLFNTSFKTPDFYERSLITGSTRVSKESLFSEVNNFWAVSVTSDLYSDCFGFTEDEVFHALDEYNLSDHKKDVKEWYDGFVFGKQIDIYNPYSISSFLEEGEYKTYWADTSSNELVSRLIRGGGDGTRVDFQKLMTQGIITCTLDENIVFADLDGCEEAIWSLLLAGGYLKAVEITKRDNCGNLLEHPVYSLSITNKETRIMFKTLVKRWFARGKGENAYEGFIDALYSYDLERINLFLNKISLQSFSYFDTANTTPEAFWQGFIIGLSVSLEKDYYVTSNRIAGTGRYDLQLKPKDKSLQAFIMELKSISLDKKTKLKAETQLKRGVREAFGQIEDNKYYTELVMEGYPVIRKLGIAFKGQLCMIGDEASIVVKKARKKTGDAG